MLIHEAADTLQVRMRKHEIHQALAEPASARLLHDEHVAQVGESGAVGYDAGERDLAVALVGAEAEGIRDAALDELAADIRHPVRLAAEEAVDRVDIQTRAIGGE